MNPIITNIIIIALMVLIIGLAVFYVIKAKKSGRKCIGCPDSSSCGTNQSGASCCSGCSGCAYNHNCHGDTPSSES